MAELDKLSRPAALDGNPELKKVADEVVETLTAIYAELADLRARTDRILKYDEARRSFIENKVAVEDLSARRRSDDLKKEIGAALDLLAKGAKTNGHAA